MAKKTTKPVEQVEMIQEDAIIGIKMSTSYYKRIQMLYTTLISEKSQAELQAAAEQIKDKKITDGWVYNLETIMILITEFQKNAQAEKKTKMVSKEEFQELVAKEVGSKD